LKTRTNSLRARPELAESGDTVFRRRRIPNVV
jgi:hypothetical protein